MYAFKLIIDGLPCFGPAFLHFTLLETQQYFGKILISIETKLVPPEIENLRTLKVYDQISFPDKVLFVINYVKM